MSDQGGAIARRVQHAVREVGGWGENTGTRAGQQRHVNGHPQPLRRKHGIHDGHVRVACAGVRRGGQHQDAGGWGSAWWWGGGGGCASVFDFHDRRALTRRDAQGRREGSGQGGRRRRLRRGGRGVGFQQSRHAGGESIGDGGVGIAGQHGAVVVAGGAAGGGLIEERAGKGKEGRVSPTINVFVHLLSSHHSLSHSPAPAVHRQHDHFIAFRFQFVAADKRAHLRNERGGRDAGPARGGGAGQGGPGGGVGFQQDDEEGAGG